MSSINLNSLKDTAKSFLIENGKKVLEGNGGEELLGKKGEQLVKKKVENVAAKGIDTVLKKFSGKLSPDGRNVLEGGGQFAKNNMKLVFEDGGMKKIEQNLKDRLAEEGTQLAQTGIDKVYDFGKAKIGDKIPDGTVKEFLGDTKTFAKGNIPNLFKEDGIKQIGLNAKQFAVDKGMQVVETGGKKLLDMAKNTEIGKKAFEAIEKHLPEGAKKFVNKVAGDFKQFAGKYGKDLFDKEALKKDGMEFLKEKGKELAKKGFEELKGVGTKLFNQGKDLIGKSEIASKMFKQLGEWTGKALNQIGNVLKPFADALKPLGDALSSIDVSGLAGAVVGVANSISFWIHGVKVPDESLGLRIMSGAVVNMSRAVIGLVANVTPIATATLKLVKHNGALLSYQANLIAANKAGLQVTGRMIEQNYQNIKIYEARATQRFEQTMARYKYIERQIDQVMAKVESTKNHFHESLEVLKETVLGRLHRTRIEAISNGLQGIFDHLTREYNKVQKMTGEAKVTSLLELLKYIKMMQKPKEGTLSTLLSDIINEGLAVPKDANDKAALQMLSLLFYGTNVYAIAFSFSIHQYAFLAEDALQKSDLGEFNHYYLEMIDCYDNFAASLLVPNHGLFDRVLAVVTTIGKRPFIREFGGDSIGNQADRVYVENYRKVAGKIRKSLASRRVVLGTLNVGFDRQMPPRLNAKLLFAEYSNISTPILKWKSKVRVSYAMQYVGQTIHSMVGDWSRPYTIKGRANPVVTNIPTDPLGRPRLIYRKIDGGHPELVAMLLNPAQTAFHDIHRDLYNAIKEDDSEIALQNMNTYLSNGADVDYPFENLRRAIHLAAEKQDIEIAKALVSHNVSISVADSKGHTPLFIASERGNLEVVRFLLSQKDAEVNAKSRPQYMNLTVLHSASYKGHGEIVGELLRHNGTEVNIEASNGLTPLHYAASFNQSSIVDKLLKIDRTAVDARSKQNFTALHYAAINNCPKVVIKLMSSGKVNPNTKALDHSTPLHLAATFGAVEVAKWLLANSTTAVNVATKDGSLPLHYAVFNGNTRLIEMLVQKDKASINRPNKAEITPLYAAFQNATTEVAKLLIANGANAKLLLSGNKTMLHLAAKNGDLNAAIKLLDQGVDLNAVDELGWKAVHYAVINGHRKIVEELLKRGTTLEKSSFKPAITLDPSKASFALIPALHLVTYLDESLALKIARLLVEHKADVNERFGKKSVLEQAAGKGFYSLSKFLLEKGASVSSEKGTQSALHAAAAVGDAATGALLIDKGANVNAENAARETPLHLAARSGAFALVKRLVASKADLQAIDKCNRHAIFHAIEGRGTIAIAVYLYHRGLDWHGVDCHKNTLLHAVANRDDKEFWNKRKAKKVVKFLKSFLKAVNRNGDTAARLAAGRGNKILLDAIMAEMPKDELKSSAKDEKNETRGDGNLLVQAGLAVAVSVGVIKSLDYWINGVEVPDDAAALRTEAGQMANATSQLHALFDDVAPLASTTLGLIQQNHALLTVQSKLIADNRQGLERTGSLIHNNYENIKKYEAKANHHFAQTMARYKYIERQIDQVMAKVESTKNHILASLEVLKETVLKAVYEARVGPITSQLKTIFNYLTGAYNKLRSLSEEAQIQALPAILEYIKLARTPTSDSLHTLLSDIINEGLAVPKDANDKAALRMLTLLCYGTNVYSVIFSFSMHQYAFLAEHALQKSDLVAYNRYYLEMINCYDNFADSLLAEEHGLFDQLLEVVTTIGEQPFLLPHYGKGSTNFQTDRVYVENYRKVAAKIRKSLAIRQEALLTLNAGLDSQVPPRLNPKLLFAEYSNISTPILEWRPKVQVSYAMQYVGQTMHSMVGDWSRPFTISGLANPLVRGIPTDPLGRSRLIYRQIDGGKPELVAVLLDPDQTAFRDINRDLYNSVKMDEPEIALKNIDTYLTNGADVDYPFENWRRAIHLAAEHANVEITKALASYNAALSVADSKGHTPLYIASERGNLEVVRFLLSQSQADVNVKSGPLYMDLSALHSASYKGHGAVVGELLVHSETDVNIEASNGLTPLHYAASFNKSSIVEKLLANKRTAVEARSKQHFTALHYAAINNCPKVVIKLMNSGKVNPNAKALDHSTPLHLAAAFGAPEAAKFLLANSTSIVDATTKDGSLPLHYAAFNGNTRLIQMLVQKDRANVNRPNYAEITPLYVAFQHNKTDAAKLLMSSCASPKLLLSGDKTMLHLAAKNGDHKAVVNLLGQGVDVNAVDELGWKAVHYAVAKSHLEIVELLLKRGTTLGKSNFKPASGLDSHKASFALIPALHLVTYLEEPIALKMAKLLVEHKADVNERFGKKSVLEQAAGKGFYSLSKFLIEKGASVTAEKGTQSALHAAAAIGDADIGSMLIEKKANVNAENAEGETPLHLAARSGAFSLVRHLVNAKANLKALDKCKRHAIFHAIEGRGSVAMAEHLFHKGLDWHGADCHKNTLLHAVANRADGEFVNPQKAKRVVKFLKSYLNNVNDNGDTAAHLAAARGNKILLDAMFAEDGKFRDKVKNMKNKEGNTPLYMALHGEGNVELVKALVALDEAASKETKLVDVAAARGKLDVVRYLVEHTAGGKGDLTNALVAASKLGKLELVKYLVNTKKANLKKALDGDKRTLVHSATAANQTEIALFFARKRLPINVTDSAGATPLHSSAALNNFPLTQYFLSHGASVNAKDKAGATPLSYAIDQKGGLEVVRLLVQHKSTLSSGSLVLRAIQKDKPEVASLLIDHGADFRSEGPNKNTPLKEAILREQVSVIRQLARKGIRLDQDPFIGKKPLALAMEKHKGKSVSAIAFESRQPFSGRSELHSAAQTGDMTLVKFLVSRGVDVNAREKLGLTPLHLAAKNNHLEVVKFLAGQKCIDVRAKNNQGSTAFDLAFASSHTDVISFLKQFQKFKLQHSASSSHSSAPSPIDFSQVDVNWTLVLLGVLTRLKTGAKYIPNAAGRSIPDAEVRAAALNVSDAFDQLVSELSIALKVPSSHFDAFQLFHKLEGLIRGGKLGEIEPLLLATAQSAFPDEARDAHFQSLLKAGVGQMMGLLLGKDKGKGISVGKRTGQVQAGSNNGAAEMTKALRRESQATIARGWERLN